jgi:hypothetical protein
MISRRARLWAVLYRIGHGARTTLRRIDADDLLGVLALILIGYGLAVFAGPWAFIIVGFLILLGTSWGAALRTFIRGR